MGHVEQASDDIAQTLRWIETLRAKVDAGVYDYDDLAELAEPLRAVRDALHDLTDAGARADLLGLWIRAVERRARDHAKMLLSLAATAPKRPSVQLLHDGEPVDFDQDDDQDLGPPGRLVVAQPQTAHAPPTSSAAPLSVDGLAMAA
jgi:hypothetical protein